MSTHAPLLSVQSLSLSIGATQVLHDVSFDIAPGEIVAVTGESGSGKSMTALATLQLLPDGATTTGRILLDNQDLTKLTETELCAIRGNTVGMVFQEPMTALNPLQTIGAQVAETIRIHTRSSRSNAHTKAAAMLTRVGLPQDKFPLSRYPHELSGGQRQRVVIALAIAQRPRLLIADEPTTALDVTTQARILDLLKELVAEFDMGLLMITHDLAVVANMAHRIVVMRHGQIVEQGATKSLFSNMQHPYTRALFKASGHQVSLPAPCADTAPLLSIKNASRTYALPRTKLFEPRTYHPAVTDVSFDITQGARIGLVGESGCGKSTLTRAILGLEPLQDGTITLLGHPVGPTLSGDIRSKMQVVFQDPYSSFNPRHRVARILSEPWHALPNPPRGQQAKDAIVSALQNVGLVASDAQKYIHEFSGGQRQRIAIARALISIPDIIIFDEAVSALDVSIRAQILDLIADLSRDRNLAYLFITHDLSVVRAVTDHVMVMKSGKIIEHGATETVFSAPQHAYTQSLIDAAPVLPDVAASKGPA